MIIETPRETVGAASLRALKDYNPDQNAINTQQEMQKGYVDELITCAKNGENNYGREKHFYLCVHTKKERLLPNVFRSFFEHRKTRPIPTYDLALYYYEPKDEKITFIWCVPAESVVDHFAGYHYVDVTGKTCWQPPATPKPGEEQLAQFCNAFRAGILL